MNVRGELLVQLAMLDAGILPFADARPCVQSYLAALPPDESRAIRRKFRKQFRNALKRQKKAVVRRSLFSQEELLDAYKVGVERDDLTLEVFFRRRALVIADIRERVLSQSIAGNEFVVTF